MPRDDLYTIEGAIAKWDREDPVRGYLDTSERPSVLTSKIDGDVVVLRTHAGRELARYSTRVDSMGRATYRDETLAAHARRKLRELDR